MSKELIRLVDCTMAFDDEVVLDNIQRCISTTRSSSHCWVPVGAARPPLFVSSVVFRRPPLGTFFLTV